MMFSDFKVGWRSLLAAPGFTAMSVLILALGIGANTAVFSLVEAVLLRPLPYARPHELFCIDSSAANQFALFSLPEYGDYRDAATGFEGLAAVSSFNSNLVDGGEAQFVRGDRISANAFDLLGVRPVAGRLLSADDDRPGAPRVAVISRALWLGTYGGQSAAIGRTVRLGGLPYTIVGVLPPDFVLPVNGNQSDVCIPLQADADPARYVRGSLHFLRIIGRLVPGVSPAQAQAALDATVRALRRRYPGDYPANGRNRMVPLPDAIVGAVRPQLLTLLGVVGALLLLASANLAGLLLVRAIGRRREFGIRAALGCTRLGLVRLLLAESLLLAAGGCVGGLLLAQWGLEALLALLPVNLPRAPDAHFNGTVFAFAALVALIAGFLPALAPLGLLGRANLRDAIGAGDRTAGGGPWQTRLRQVLAAVQVALAVALLAGTGLFLRSFRAVVAVRPGFEASRALSLRLSLPEAGYRDPAALIRFETALRDRLARLPGVQAVGATSLLPLTTGLATVEFSIEGRPPLRVGERPSADYRLVTPGFFAAMRIPLLQGRWFTEEDDGQRPLAILVNAALAQAWFPDGRVLGQRLLVDDTDTGSRTFQIVGVVGNVKETKLEDPPTFEVYVPFRQMDPAAVPWIRYRNDWVLRTAAASEATVALARQAIRAVDPGVPVAAVRTLKQVLDGARAARRFTLVVISFFAGTALLLTVAGIYTVIAFGVAGRTREMGVRLALGATGRQIVLLVLREGLGLLATGAAAGTVAALGLSRLVAAQLYGVSPSDPLALAAAVLLLLGVGFVACWLPARRAARTDPLVALRAE